MKFDDHKADGIVPLGNISAATNRSVRYYISLVKRKRAFEHTQSTQVQNILRMRKISSVTLVLIHTFCSIQWFCYGAVESLIRPLVRRLIWAFSARICPKLRFRMAWANYILTVFIQRIRTNMFEQTLLCQIRRGSVRRLIWHNSVCFSSSIFKRISRS